MCKLVCVKLSKYIHTYKQTKAEDWSYIEIRRIFFYTHTHTNIDTLKLSRVRTNAYYTLTTHAYKHTYSYKDIQFYTKGPTQK